LLKKRQFLVKKLTFKKLAIDNMQNFTSNLELNVKDENFEWEVILLKSCNIGNERQKTKKNEKRASRTRKIQQVARTKFIKLIMI
jgi:hypothetical protein